MGTRNRPRLRHKRSPDPLAARIRAADDGDSRAAADVVHWLLPARRPQRLALARRYAEMASSGKDSEAADWAAVCFLYPDSCGGWEDPRGNGADPKWALGVLRRLARAGNVHSMHSLYLAYWRGAGVARDVDVAERWARRAAKHGDCEPLNNIGVSFREREGVRRDIRRAVRCYRTAAALGYPMALRNLSKCYEHGEGMRKDDRRSVRLLRRAVRLNPPLRSRPAPCASAWFDLGWRLVHGHGVREDRGRGLRLLRRAAKAGWETAQESLRDLGPTTTPTGLRPRARG